MSRSEPFITVYCNGKDDKCGMMVDIPYLCKQDDHLRRSGWAKTGDADLCPSCYKAALVEVLESEQ